MCDGLTVGDSREVTSFCSAHSSVPALLEIQVRTVVAEVCSSMWTSREGCQSEGERWRAEGRRISHAERQAVAPLGSLLLRWEDRGGYRFGVHVVKEEEMHLEPQHFFIFVLFSKTGSHYVAMEFTV